MNIAVFYGCVFYFFYHFRQVGLNVGLTEQHVFFTFLSDLQSTMNLIFIVVSLISVVVLLGFGIVISHRIAGPLYRLNMHMASVTETKNLKPVKFRKGDYFLEIQDSFNKMVEKFEDENK